MQCAEVIINIVGSGNVATGYNALSKSNGNGNTANGTQAGLSLNTGNNNVFMGNNAGSNATSGSDNVFVGLLAGATTTTGGNNIVIGANTSLPNIAGNDQLVIGNAIVGTSINTLATAKIGIANNAPLTTLDVDGNLALRSSGTLVSAAPVAADFTKSYIRYSATTALTTLPAGVQVGQFLFVEFTTASTVTINNTGNIKTPAGTTYNQNDVVQFIWNGTNWLQVTASKNN